jgi:ABC-type spermidine/putrescine transport system permease subunit I
VVAARSRNPLNPLWIGLASPGMVWMAMFFVVPFYAVAAVAFGQVDPILQTAAPEWNPRFWDFSSFSEVFDRVINGDLGTVFARTGLYVVLAVLGCILVGYPVAYFVSRCAGKWKTTLLVLMILPFWVSYLMRMLAWVNLLQPEGWAAKALNSLPGVDRSWLNGQPITVVFGLIYGYLPFFILPLYATLDRIDGRLLEAARDLGASGRQTFWRVTLPLSRQGLIAASVITALPMVGDYYTNDLLSASPRTEMIGNQIVYFLQGTTQPQVGASLVLILSVLLLVLMAGYLVSVSRAQKLVTR